MMTLDGQKDEDYWKHTPTYKFYTYLINKTDAASLLNTADPDSMSVNCSFVNDKNKLYMFLEILKESADSSIDEMSDVLSYAKNIAELEDVQVAIQDLQFSPPHFFDKNFI